MTEHEITKGWRCRVCGKISADKKDIFEHIIDEHGCGHIDPVVSHDF